MNDFEWLLIGPHSPGLPNKNNSMLLIEAAEQNLAESKFFQGVWLKTALSQSPYKWQALEQVKREQAKLAKLLIWC